MIGRHSFRFGDTEVTLFTGWNSWLVGVALERHPHEWTLNIHAGPVMLSVFRFR